MRESKIEARLRDEIRALGGRCYKWVSPGQNGVPDRIVIMPGGRIYFIELKAPQKAPRELQKIVHGDLRDLGCTVLVMDSLDQMSAWVAKLKWEAEHVTNL